MQPQSSRCPICQVRLASGLTWCSDNHHRRWLVREFGLVYPDVVVTPRPVPAAVRPAPPAAPPVDAPVHQAERVAERPTPSTFALLLAKLRGAV